MESNDLGSNRQHCSQLEVAGDFCYGLAVPAGRKPTMTRDEFVEAAILLADAEGINELSLRSLGRAMGVSATAVYRYFRDKDELIVQIREALLGQVLASSLSASTPRELIINLGLVYRQMAREHPCLSQIMVMSVSDGETAGGVPTLIAQTLEELGVEVSKIGLGYRQLESFVIGTCYFDFSDAPRHIFERYERMQRSGSPALTATFADVAAVEQINEDAYSTTLHLLVDSLVN